MGEQSAAGGRDALGISAKSDPPGAVDLFISYAGPDRPWAEWAAWELKAAGYTVELAAWDWSAGDNIALRISDALARARRVLALCSPAYFERDRFTTDEWTGAMGLPPDSDGRRRLIPIRVAHVEPPLVLRPLAYRDVFGLDQERARAELLAAVGGPVHASQRPAYPGGAHPGLSSRSAGESGDDRRARPRTPGSLPAVWKVPHRNYVFTGRQAVLARLREKLDAGDRAVVQALHGMGGVGKTQLAIEYAHLFAGDYELVWWIDAERPELIGEQLVALAVTAGWVAPNATAAPGIAAAQDWLRRQPGWLLIFDNAETPDGIARWLPDGPGHLLVTSRHGGFGALGEPVDVDVFDRPESIALLRTRAPRLSDSDADRLADALGDLPLALAQAGGLLAETGMSAAEYLRELRGHAAELLTEGRPVGYPAPLAAAIKASLDRVAADQPATVNLLHVCAYLAPDPIPLSWLSGGPASVLGDALIELTSSRRRFRLALGGIASLGLARTAEDSLQLHRLTQAVLRDDPPLASRDTIRRRAIHLLTTNRPDDNGTDPASWPAWALLLPHVLAANPATTLDPNLRSLACDAVWYLARRGDYHTAVRLARTWHEAWLHTHGPDDQHTLWIASNLGTAYRNLGHYQAARDLDQDTLTRYRRVHGDDHDNTLALAHSLANDLCNLGDYQGAHDLHQDTLIRRRRVLGVDHPYTLRSANNLANDLRSLGDHQAAHDLHQGTLTRCRRVLGEDHPYTLSSANDLANDLRNLGDHQAAHDLHQDTLIRRRRVLGEDHPDTLRSATNLAADLRSLGEHEGARDLHQDTLTRFRRVLGDDHPDTPAAAADLARDLRTLGDEEAVRRVEEEFGLPIDPPYGEAGRSD